MAEFLSGATVNPHGIRSISDIIAHAEAEPAEQIDTFPVDELVAARDEPDTSMAASAAAQAQRRREEVLGAEVQDLLDACACDVLMTPLMSLPLDLGRLPALVVPLGRARDGTAPRKVLSSKRDGLFIGGPGVP